MNLGVEVLSASFIVDAVAFFSVSSRWPNLSHLTLTAQLLAPTTCHMKIMDLLETAASAACYMPELKIKEIWYGREGLAALFKYEFTPGSSRQSVITWRATWRMSIQPRVTEAWEGLYAAVVEALAALMLRMRRSTSTSRRMLMPLSA